MQKQYSVEYVGAPNLPSGGLEYRLPKIGRVLAGKRKLVFLTEDRFREARKLPGLEVKLVGTAESVRQSGRRFGRDLRLLGGLAKLSEVDREATETKFVRAIAKISEDETRSGARLRKLVASLAPGRGLWNAQDALAGIGDAAEAKRQGFLAGFALEIEKKAALEIEKKVAVHTARPAVEAGVALDLPAESKTKTKKRGST